MRIHIQMRLHGFPHTNGKSFDEYDVHGKYIANFCQIFTGAYIQIFHKFWCIRLHSHAHATKSKLRSGSKVQWPTSVYVKPSSKWTWVTLDLPFQFLLLRRRAVDRCMRHQCHSGQPLVMHCVFFHFLPNFKQRSYFSKAWVPNNSLHQRFRHRNHLERKDISVKKLNFHQLAELMGFIPTATGWKGNRYNCFFSFRSKQACKEPIHCNKTCESTEVCIFTYSELKWWGERGFTNEKREQWRSQNTWAYLIGFRKEQLLCCLGPFVGTDWKTYKSW